MTDQTKVVIEVVGEGKTDVGLTKNPDESKQPRAPQEGVIPILVNWLCGKPDAMLVKRHPYSTLQGKTREQKVHFAKRQALYNRSAGVVFVVDSEGDLKGRTQELTRGRDRAYPEYPMAIGVAHPCVESWLLADAAAIRLGLGLATTPNVPDEPEHLPAPCKNAQDNPKSVLRRISGVQRKEISAEAKHRIAIAMNDMALVRERCPESFAPFADEVTQHIHPLFRKPCSPA